MATRGRMTFQKRQKEMARKERRLMKAERRAQRKAGILTEPAEQPEDANQPAPVSETQETQETGTDPR